MGPDLAVACRRGPAFTVSIFSLERTRGEGPSLDTQLKKLITLGGGSLGSCVDEERSQLRELM